jgi:Sec-independent protein translocase protein TatA
LNNFLESIIDEVNYLNESQMAFYNLEKSLMIEEHKSILNEGAGDFARAIKEGIFKILNKIRELIARFVAWVGGKFSAFIRAVKREVEKAEKELEEEDNPSKEEGEPESEKTDETPKKPDAPKKEPATKKQQPVTFEAKGNLINAKTTLDKAVANLSAGVTQFSKDFSKTDLSDRKNVSNRAMLDELRKNLRKMISDSKDLVDNALKSGKMTYSKKDYKTLTALKKAIIDSLEKDKDVMNMAHKMLQQKHNELRSAIKAMESEDGEDYTKKKYESYYNLSTALLEATQSISSASFHIAGQKTKVLKETMRATKILGKSKY